GNGVGNSGRRGHQAALPNALRAVWPGPVSVLDQDALQVRREVCDSGDAVIEQAGVEQLAVLINHFLEKGAKFHSDPDFKASSSVSCSACFRPGRSASSCSCSAPPVLALIMTALPSISDR